MIEQTTTTPGRAIAPAIAPDEALRLLAEAWAYFTPGPAPVLPEPAYEDLPLAA